MAKIPESYLPPPELRPKRIYNLDEFKNIPQKFNSTEVLLDQTAAKYGDKVAIHFDDKSLTYKQLQASVNRVANGLKKLGVEEGDRVLVGRSHECDYPAWVSRLPVLGRPTFEVNSPTTRG